LKPKRIFWFGMHKVLSQTELPRLRQLGFEVFNPPYLSDVKDQSAVYDWSEGASTLPNEVLKKLSETNFFYQSISEEIAEILNEFFDAAIVTINPTWLMHFMDAYKGPVIYRVYGQPYSLSQELTNNLTFAKINERDNFWFCPHSEYTLDIEDGWLLERMRIVPYCLTQDIVELKDEWKFKPSDSTIGLLCPRAADIPYYNNNYNHLGHFFPGDSFRIFGAQLIQLSDPRIVGTLEREDYLNKFSKLRGFVYHYEEPTVCYLPPIEFMMVGGPVVFQSGSLLAQYFSNGAAPGMAKNVEELALFASRLRSGDQVFIQEIIESQNRVRELYSPDYVWPKFDKSFSEMLNLETPAPAPNSSVSELIVHPKEKAFAVTLAPRRNTVLRKIIKKNLLFALFIVRYMPALKPKTKLLLSHFPSLNAHLRAFSKVHRSSIERNSIDQRAPEREAYGRKYSLPKGRNILCYVDHTVSCPVNTGMQRVVRGLSRSLIEHGEMVLFVKWNFDHSKLVLVTRDELIHLSRWNGPDLASIEMDIYPAPQEEDNWLLIPEVLYINNHPSAVTLEVITAAKQLSLNTAFIFYDATPLRRKEFSDIAFVHEKYMRQLMLADLIIPISTWSASDLTAFFTHHELTTLSTIPKIVSIPLPGESILSPRRTNVNGLTREVILSVGSISTHKNQLSLVRAFKLFIQRHPQSKWQLCLLGNIHHDLLDELNSLALDTPLIKVLNALSDEELDRLYDECSFTVFPSVLEGFGLPILESLWYGKPCICANFGAMAEVANPGGCLMIDVRNSGEILSAIEQLVFDPETLSRLQVEAMARPIITWKEYAHDVLMTMSNENQMQKTPDLLITLDSLRFKKEIINVSLRPLLSICISTYNRAEWLKVNLQNLKHLIPVALEEVEVIVCDNASTDDTAEVVKPYLERKDFKYHCNERNVGMLGNLRETVHHAQGKYIWVLGDDDLLMAGAIERILKALQTHKNISLVYLNYAFTQIEDARTISNFKTFFRDVTPIVPPEPDLEGSIRSICARNENFFTAIYTLVLRRDHAIHAYSQDTSGRPFSTMLTCIPTTYYVLHNMMNELGVWVGEPQLVVNMNVSWLKYAPLWILERIPEVYDLAERKGVPVDEVDRWRRHTLPGVAHYFRTIFENDPLNNADYFKADRVVRRFSHLKEFSIYFPEMHDIYKRAHLEGHPAAIQPVSVVFPRNK